MMVCMGSNRVRGSIKTVAMSRQVAASESKMLPFEVMNLRVFRGKISLKAQVIGGEERCRRAIRSKRCPELVRW